MTLKAFAANTASIARRDGWLSQRVLATLSLLLISSSALGADKCAIQRDFLIDSSNRMQVEDLNHQAMQPYSGVLHAGNSYSTIWVRLRVDCVGTGSDDAPRLIQINPRALDTVQAFVATEGKPVELLAVTPHRYVGNFFPRKYALPANKQSAIVYVRVRSAGTIIVDATLETAVDAERRDEAMLAVALLALTVTATATLFSFLQVIIRDDPVLRPFLIFQLMTLVYQLFAIPFWYPLVADARQHLMMRCVGFLAAAAGVRFQTMLLAEYRPSLRWSRLGLALIGGAFLAIALAIAGHSVPAMHLFAAMLCGNAIYFLGLVITARQFAESPEASGGCLSRRQMLTVAVVLAITRLLAAFAIEGPTLVSWTTSPTWLFALLTPMSALMFLGVMWKKTQHGLEVLVAQSMRAKLVSELANGERDRQRVLFSMLTHELRTPLSVLALTTEMEVRSTASSAAARQAIGDMARIVEHVLLADQVANDVALTFEVPLPMGDILDKILESAQAPNRILLQADEESRSTCVPARATRIICRNLIENAVKYSAPDSPISVLLTLNRRDGQDGVCLEIANQLGVAGWPSQTHVFKQYYREKAAHHATGAGLGRYLSERLAAASGATLTYNPTATKVKFILWMPR